MRQRGRVVLLAFFSSVPMIMSSIFGCGDDLKIVVNHPNDLKGTWERVVPAIDVADTLHTILIFNSNGQYAFSDSLVISEEAVYWENGSWEVHFLDENGDGGLDLDEDHRLRLDVRASKDGKNDGNVDFADYDLTGLDTHPLLTITLTGSSMITLEKAE